MKAILKRNSKANQQIYGGIKLFDADNCSINKGVVGKKLKQKKLDIENDSVTQRIWRKLRICEH